ncbi:unnamed protein product [Paramecium pentaurelia]|uniref:Transmembrane protein n=1 Tax=Paramecium pentaurelia TaxID=43138 RepID=A0A8S1VMZ5_9CILI|nr:unnamed protein product [Paramecium pentaurelia]
MNNKSIFLILLLLLTYKFFDIVTQKQLNLLQYQKQILINQQFQLRSFNIQYGPIQTIRSNLSNFYILVQPIKYKMGINCLFVQLGEFYTFLVVKNVNQYKDIILQLIIVQNILFFIKINLKSLHQIKLKSGF